MRRLLQRRRFGRLVGAAGGAWLFGCRGAVMSSPASAADVSLEAFFERIEDMLRVRYTLRNNSGALIGAYDGAGGPPEVEWPDLAGSVYVSLQSRNLVAVKRVRPPLPKTKDINRIRLPAATRLEPGEVRTVGFALPLPLAEHSEYFPAHAKAEWREGEVSQIRLTIGIQRAGADAVFQPRPNNPDLFKLASGFQAQEYVSAEQALIVPVRARIDQPFERV